MRVYGQWTSSSLKSNIWRKNGSFALNNGTVRRYLKKAYRQIDCSKRRTEFHTGQNDLYLETSMGLKLCWSFDGVIFYIPFGFHFPTELCTWCLDKNLARRYMCPAVSQKCGNCFDSGDKQHCLHWTNHFTFAESDSETSREKRIWVWTAKLRNKTHFLSHRRMQKLKCQCIVTCCGLWEERAQCDFCSNRSLDMSSAKKLLVWIFFCKYQWTAQMVETWILGCKSTNQRMTLNSHNQNSARLLWIFLNMIMPQRINT